MDIAILVVVGYVAVVALVRLMLAHRRRLLAEFREKMARQKGTPAEDAKPPRKKSRGKAA
ncbi:MAG: hypothetical protein ACYC35_16410 [Pirellulales bacterium]